MAKLFTIHLGSLNTQHDYTIEQSASVIRLSVGSPYGLQARMMSYSRVQ